MVFDLLSAQTNWDVERLADRVKNTRPQSENGTSVEDDRLAKYFENPQFGEFTEPATVLDRYGRIILWYLPLIFSRYRVVMLFTVLFCF
jgi:alpha-amylase/alpha-mannosidase (GH57 family)